MITGLTLATSQHIGEHQDNWQLWDCCFFYDPAIHGTPQAISEYSLIPAMP
jgi:hypothetical protein